MMRERYLMEMLVSMTIGGLGAFILALITPGETILIKLMFYVIYWVVSSTVVWTVIDIVDFFRRDGYVDSNNRDA